MPDTATRTAPTFWLGSHEPSWLERTTVPLFVSHRRLLRRRTLPRAIGPWALDSGAFSEIAANGQFETSPQQYATAVRRYADEIGGMTWAAPQDWMCEPIMLAKTGLTVAEHQRRTVASYLDLQERAPDLPWVPVLQGYDLADYLRCVDLYAAVGVQLQDLPLVGLGSVCRRQATSEIAVLTATLAGQGLKLHGFGVKTAGLDLYGQHLASADSMAWSYAARRSDPLPDCTGHRNCANCVRYALAWRGTVLDRLRRALSRPVQYDLWGAAA
ncbi:hypothetical protein BBK14_11335 [Parafrankia soli]|uniref:DeoxyPurine in DNA protein A domain-containing protein n=1 Tax=Parafrankia soli TaxID=2599596 RepID=A0A1S1R8C7_9ACTN|nr:hypothetical protein [Parafrankia soli]OHV42207.1 hypothetical protein BBK14_11335 [Parafrankia soli]